MTPHLLLGEGDSMDDGFCDLAFGSTQNDSIGGEVWESNENNGRVQSCACGVESDHLALPSFVPLPPSAIFPPLLEDEIYSLDDGFCDSALWLCAEWQGGRHTSKIEGFWTLETNQKGVWCDMHWFFIDAMFMDFLLIHLFSIEQDRFISGSLELHSFMNWFLLPLYHLTLMSFCTKGILARSCRIHSHHIMPGAGGIG